MTLTNGSTTPPTELGTITLDAGGSGTYSTSSLTAGTYSVTAAYSGDGEYDLSTSAAAKLTITAPPIGASTTTTLAASAIGVVEGISITFTGTVKSSGGRHLPVPLPSKMEAQLWVLASQRHLHLQPGSVTPSGAAVSLR